MNEKLISIFDRIPDAILEKTRFGRSESLAYWVNGPKILDLCRLLVKDAGLNVLENLSCMQVDESLVLTYFLRSSISGESAIFRVNAEIPSNDYLAKVLMTSVDTLWEIAKPFESEIARLFGVSFQAPDTIDTHPFPSDWNGYPLRKDFVLQDQERGVH